MANTLEALLPVSDGAVSLAETIRDVVAGDGPDGFRPERLVRARDDGEIEMHVDELHRLANLSGLDVCEKTVYRWVDQLTEAGCSRQMSTSSSKVCRIQPTRLL